MHKDTQAKEKKLLTYLSKEKKTEFEKLLEELEKKPVPKRRKRKKNKEFNEALI